MIQQLKNCLKEQNPEEVLEVLSALQDEKVEHIDDLIVKSYHLLAKKHLKEFLDLLYDLVVLMRDPRNIVVYLLNHQTKDSKDSILVSKFIYFVMENYDFQFNGFYENLIECLTVENLEEETEVKMYFIVNMLYNNSFLGVSLMKAAVKKLMGVSLESRSQVALSIIYSVLFIMRSNPVLYGMTSPESQESIFGELEIHSESIEEISSLAKRIKKEADNKNLRVKFVNLSSMKYPTLCL